MSALRPSAVAVALLVGLVTSTHAQLATPGARFAPQASEYPENTRPLAEPGVFDYDAQLFAPVEFNDFDERELNTGFYAVVDRVYHSVSRGSARDELPIGVSENAVPTGNDWQWGNRYELGWMTDAGSGWQASYEYSSGSWFASGRDETIAQPLMVTTKFANVELNRVFRQPLSHGGNFEPYIGFRYYGINDRTIEDTVTLLNTGAQAGNRFKQNASNSAAGAHVGGRYSVNRGRFRYSMDGAIATTYNRQRYTAEDILFFGTSVATNSFFDADDAFVPALDTRLELAYSLTRDIGLRTGFQFHYLWDGIARTDNTTTGINPNSALGLGGQAGVFDESTTVAGFNFGLEWRR